MAPPTLVIGNKNYSSWSLRPWLFMKKSGVPFEEIRIPLYQPGSSEKLREYSPSGLVPLLLDGDLRVWDSLAICEYVSEKFLDGKGWPADRRVRAVARSVSAEMHAGFLAVRANLPMNLRAKFAWKSVNDEVDAGIRRIIEIWTRCREQHGGAGPWLFGEFTIADAMYAPVAWRFNSYGVPLEGEAARYLHTLLEMDEMRAWHAGALGETEVLPQCEARDIWPQ
ncbi:MAG: glutathione S-transferase family protein [Sulfurimicrobium sp.]|nr:glutathione S-transferase family protein [Sulfurimicrobium sp.]